MKLFHYYLPVFCQLRQANGCSLIGWFYVKGFKGSSEMKERCQD